jgi:regulator of replication initiation timing
MDTDKLIAKLVDMADRKTRYHYSVGDYWNALGDAAEALSVLQLENAQLREYLARAQDRATEHTKQREGR